MTENEVSFNWDILLLHSYKNYNNLPLVVKKIQWRLEATHITSSITKTMNGITTIPFPIEETFTELHLLTKEEVIQWLDGTDEIHMVKQKLISGIEDELYELLTIVPPFRSGDLEF